MSAAEVGHGDLLFIATPSFNVTDGSFLVFVPARSAIAIHTGAPGVGDDVSTVINFVVNATTVWGEVSPVHVFRLSTYISPVLSERFPRGQHPPAWKLDSRCCCESREPTCLSQWR